MTETVFFSWQVDNPTIGGRDLIERAIERALTRLSGTAELEKAIRDNISVDRDTKGIPGSPPIAETIFNKIDKAAVFVPDLTFVGHRVDGRPTPNPNVLIEYGWALKSCGYSCIIPVMNAAYGDPTDANLPFDLRHLRHPMTYYCPDDASDAQRSAAQEKLTNHLFDAIGEVLGAPDFVSRRNPGRAFSPRPSIDGGGRFREPDGALGHSEWTRGGEKQVYLCDGPLRWFRLMPSRALQRQIPVSRLRSEIRPTEQENRLRTFRLGFNAISVRGADGYGTCDVAPGQDQESRILVTGAAFMFTTGEIWTVDGHAGPRGRLTRSIPLSEEICVQLLREYASLLRRLDISGPYRWIAGLEELQGRGLFLRGQLAPTGSCAEDSIEVQGTLKDGEEARDALEPFFERVYTACGISRQDRK